MKILEHASHSDLRALLHAYSTWVSELWNRYPKQLFETALRSVVEDNGEKLMPEVLLVYHIRKIRKDYTNTMGSSEETQLHRSVLSHPNFYSQMSWEVFLEVL